eukprot:c20781_g1_i1.p1 GENE.c20781_g1_i1~~c20781_g1_i1.p1  ORF type:complete len:835 (+),score=168.93 c20781_g1_i1:401-2905(+)
MTEPDEQPSLVLPESLLAEYEGLQKRLDQLFLGGMHIAAQEWDEIVKLFPHLAGLVPNHKGSADRSDFLQVHRDTEALAHEFRQRAVLGIAFVGPLKSGKSTLINVLLTSKRRGGYLEILPTNMSAETSHIWKVSSSAAQTPVIKTDGQVCPHNISNLEDLAEFVKRFSRDGDLGVKHGPIEIEIPLSWLDPFEGQPYCLIDTPGIDETHATDEELAKYLTQEVPMIGVVCPLTGGVAVCKSTDSIVAKFQDNKFFVLSKYDELLRRPPKKGEDLRQSLSKHCQAFERSIREKSHGAKIFKLGLGPFYSADPEDEYDQCRRRGLAKDQMESWLDALRDYIAVSFMKNVEKSDTLQKRCTMLRTIYRRLREAYHNAIDSEVARLRLEALKALSVELENARLEMIKKFRVDCENRLKDVRNGILQQAQAVESNIKESFRVKGKFCNKLLDLTSQKVRAQIRSAIEQACQNQLGDFHKRADKAVDTATADWNAGPSIVNHGHTGGHIEVVRGVGIAVQGAVVAGVIVALSSPLVIAVVVGGSIALVGNGFYLATTAMWRRATAVTEIAECLEKAINWEKILRDAEMKFDRHTSHLVDQSKMQLSEEFMNRVGGAAVQACVPDYELFLELQKEFVVVADQVLDFATTERGTLGLVHRDNCVALLLAGRFGRVISLTQQYLQPRSQVLELDTWADLLCCYAVAVYYCDEHVDLALSQVCSLISAHPSHVNCSLLMLLAGVRGSTATKAQVEAAMSDDQPDDDQRDNSLVIWWLKAVICVQCCGANVQDDIRQCGLNTLASLIEKDPEVKQIIPPLGLTPDQWQELENLLLPPPSHENEV